MLVLRIFDLGNLPLIHNIGKIGVPVFISIGGGQYDQIESSVQTLRELSVDVTVLHCVSEYPCQIDHLGLSNLKVLVENFPDCTIGLSDHFNGTLSGPIAYLEGARVFEKHVTMNRSWKGTDHSFALERDGFRRFVRDIKRVPLMFKQKPTEDLGNEYVFSKLGKSIVAKDDIEKDSKLSLSNISGKVFKETIVPIRMCNQFIGQRINKDLKKGQPINFDDIC